MRIPGLRGSPSDTQAGDLVVGEWQPPARRSPWRRPTRIGLIIGSVLLVLVLGFGVTGYVLASSTLSSMRRIPDPFKGIPAAQRPPAPTGAAGKDVTFLLGGLDTRSPALTTGSLAQSSMRGRTDTLMMVRLLAGGRGAYVVSIPRDSWVPIPGYGMGKVNWAYYFGGPTLAIRTVEDLTHVRVNHIAVIDWTGFRGVTDALGGVSIYIPATSYDPANNITWTKGMHHLDGAQALLYVRDRYGLAGGDFQREQRQQNFLRALFTEIHHQASPQNLWQTGSVLHMLSQVVSVDNTLSNSDIVRLAYGMRHLSMGNIVFATVPYSGTGSVGGQSVVELNRSLGPGFWRAFNNDTLVAYMQAHQLAPLGATTP